MLTTARIHDALNFVDWVLNATHGQGFPASTRRRAAASCYAIVQDHHHAMVVLVEKGLYASTFALLRLQFETYIRGVWVADCANEADVERLICDAKLNLKIQKLISAIEDKNKSSELSNFKERVWSAMCDYTHTGARHIQRWNTDEGIEPKYSVDEVEEVLRCSEIITCLSVLGLAQLANNEELASRVQIKLLERQGQQRLRVFPF